MSDNNEIGTSVNDLVEDLSELVQKGLAMLPEITSIVAAGAITGAGGALGAAITELPALTRDFDAFLKETQEVIDSAKQTKNALINSEEFKNIAEEAKVLQTNLEALFDGIDAGNKHQSIEALGNVLKNIEQISREVINLAVTTEKTIDFSQIAGLGDAIKGLGDALGGKGIEAAKGQSQAQGQNQSQGQSV